MPKLVDAEEQRRRIRRAAGRVFTRRGVAGTGLAHVAEAAGMGRSSLYHYYPDKSSLLRDLAGDLLVQEEALFAAAAAGEGSPRARVEALLGGMIAGFAEYARLARLVLELRSRDARRFRPFFRSLRAHLARVLEEGQRTGEIAASLHPERTAAVLIGAVDGLLLQYFVEPGAFPDLEALRDAVVRCARGALAP